jgi:tetratricopeptide (TPR) repeat protein
MSKRIRFAAALAGTVLSAVGGTLAAGRNPPLTTAELLVDLARDHALLQRGQQTTADVEHVHALLRAAVRLDPTLAHAHAWLYELAVLSGDKAGAATALAGLLNADPTNYNAFALWLAAGARSHQTAEKRSEWLKAVATAPRPPAMQALAYVALAQVAIERMDTEAARQHLERALELEPASPEAAVLAIEMLDDETPPGERLRALLRLVAAQPLRLDAIWQVGLLLDEYGHAEDARTFYDYGLSLRPADAPAAALPGGFWLDAARNRHACGQTDEAIECARQAIAADPAGAAEAGMYLHYLLNRKGRTVDASAVLTQLTQRFAALADPSEWPLNEVAQAAWFYCVLAPDHHRAELLAGAAGRRAPHDPFVQRVVGWSQAFARKTDEARQTLTPLAARDAYATYMLAKLALESGQAEEAHRVLRALDPRPRAGLAADMLARLESTLATSQPASQPTDIEDLTTRPVPVTQPAFRPWPELTDALAEFDSRVLRFKDAPAQFLEARVVLDDLSPAPGEPWWVTFTLTNRGPFPITLGPDALVNPVFVLSFSMEGDRTRSYPALMTVSLDRLRVLYPGQSTRARRTLDVGPLRRASQQTPQQAQRIEIQVLLDGHVDSEGQWHLSPGGQQLRPAVYFNRLPASVGREALAALWSALEGDSEPARARAIAVLAELLGERQRAELTRLSYEPAPVPAERLRAALLGLLGHDSWETRVRTLAALQTVGLDRAMTEAVERCLDHPHWLVRLMAVRVLARQGRAFAERAQSIATQDADELVRALAQSQLARWAVETRQESGRAESGQATVEKGPISD